MNDELTSLQLDTPIRRYFDVLYTCDLELYDQLFHTACHLFTVAADGTETVLSSQAYREILSKRTSPRERSQRRDEEAILDVQRLAKDIALVQVRVRVGVNLFRDQLMFVRSNSQWKLASKFYTVESTD